jgi:formylglycine-generating enzyme required for sulfatase activity
MFKINFGLVLIFMSFVVSVFAEEIPSLDWQIIPAGESELGASFCLEEQGNTDWCSDEVPHRVRLDEFMILRSEVTNQLYYKCFKAGVCEPNELHETRPRDFSGKNQPVVFVTWSQAQDFCDWTGGRLPTESEWERAAKKRELGGAIFGRKYNIGAPNVVESVHPNSLGVYDLLGNVYEWTQDWYGPFVTNEIQVNPKGPQEGNQKVIKGGAWNSPAHYIRVADRVARDPKLSFSDLGFRCVKSNNRKDDS